MEANGLPACTAFLALSVLAAYEMHGDEAAGPNAFYRRLSELLALPLAGSHPPGFTTRDFEWLWRLLGRWVAETTAANLPFPEHPGVRRFIALPLAHVPLRRIDTEKLPDFFLWAGYEPNSRVNAETIQRDLLAWPGLRTGSEPRRRCRSVRRPARFRRGADRPRTRELGWRVEGYTRAPNRFGLPSPGLHSTTAAAVIRRPLSQQFPVKF